MPTLNELIKRVSDDNTPRLIRLHGKKQLTFDKSKKLFYGLDSAWLLYDEIKAIKEKHIDLAVLDGTIGNAEGDYRIFEHNNLRMIREMKLTLNPYVDRFAISHMARTLHEPQEVLAAEMANYEIEVAFDGWETEI